MTASLLPANSTRLERAIEQAMHGRLNALPNPIRTLWNPDTCPAHLLGWLAWANSVDVWDQDWTEAQKRESIRASYLVHLHKGTVGSVRRALAALNIGLEIVEWFESEDQPGTFRIDAFADYVFAGGFGINPALVAMIAAQIDQAKRASQHYTLRVGESFVARTSLRAGTRIKGRDRNPDLAPQPRTHGALFRSHVRQGARMVGTHRQIHDFQARAA